MRAAVGGHSVCSRSLSAVVRAAKSSQLSTPLPTLESTNEVLGRLSTRLRRRDVVTVARFCVRVVDRDRERAARAARPHRAPTAAATRGQFPSGRVHRRGRRSVGRATDSGPAVSRVRKSRSSGTAKTARARRAIVASRRERAASNARSTSHDVTLGQDYQRSGATVRMVDELPLPVGEDPSSAQVTGRRLVVGELVAFHVPALTNQRCG